MERRVNKRINEYFSGFKQNVKTEIIKVIEGLKNTPNCTCEEGNGYCYSHTALKGLIQYVCDYEKCELMSTDFEKRKRSKNNVPIHEQCIAKKADESRCTRRKRDGSEYCGTHIKGTPHGDIQNNTTDDEIAHKQSGLIMTLGTNIPVEKTKKVEVWLEDINGIMHYIDNNYNVYDNEDIIKGVSSPKVIYKYEKDYVNGNEIYRIQES